MVCFSIFIELINFSKFHFSMHIMIIDVLTEAKKVLIFKKYETNAYKMLSFKFLSLVNKIFYINYMIFSINTL